MSSSSSHTNNGRDPLAVGTDAVFEAARLADWRADVESVCQCGADRYASRQETLRAEFQRQEQAFGEGFTANVCELLGWRRKDRESLRADTDKLREALGLKPERQRNGKRQLRRRLDDDLAIEMARALNLDVREVGL